MSDPDAIGPALFQACNLPSAAWWRGIHFRIRRTEVVIFGGLHNECEIGLSRFWVMRTKPSLWLLHYLKVLNGRVQAEKGSQGRHSPNTDKRQVRDTSLIQVVSGVIDV